MKKNTLLFMILFSLSGCYDPPLTTSDIRYDIDDKTNLNAHIDDTVINSINQNEDVEILRYKVSSNTPVFASGRKYGVLAIENNCLVIQQADTIWALALPISDDTTQHQTHWDQLH